MLSSTTAAPVTGSTISKEKSSTCLVTVTHGNQTYHVSWGGKKQGAVEWIVSVVESLMPHVDTSSLMEASELYDEQITCFMVPHGETRLLWFIPSLMPSQGQDPEVENNNNGVDDDAKSIAQSVASHGTQGTTASSNRREGEADVESVNSRTSGSSGGNGQILISNGTPHSLNVYTCIHFTRIPGTESLLITSENIFKHVTYGMINQSVDNEFLTSLLDSTLHTYDFECEEKKSFLNVMQETTQNLGDVVLLAKPSKKYDIEASAKGHMRAAQKSEIVRTFEQTIQRWAQDVKHVLSQSQSTLAREDDGPLLELAYWRHRVVVLSCFLDQIQTRNNQTIVSILTTAGSRAAKSLAMWKETEQQLEAAAAEATDNVKYLASIEKYCQPMYVTKPDLSVLMGCIPSLIHAIRMMQGISRFYHTSLRLTSLMVRITNQLILCCRRHLSEEPGKSILDSNAAEGMEKINLCIALNDCYQFHFKEVRAELATSVCGKQFDMSESAIFGAFDLFVGRLQKIKDILELKEQFEQFRSCAIENMDRLVMKFDQQILAFRANNVDFLDSKKNSFDTIYSIFKHNVAEISSDLVVLINNSFLTIPTTSKALTLLQHFRAIVHPTSHLVQLLDEKHHSIFVNLGRDIEAIRLVYERDKASPPIVRNVPPAAGVVMWARQLLHNIEIPMSQFTQSSSLFQSKDAKKVVVLYNKVAQALVLYETQWIEKWASTLDTVRTGLEATLLHCDKATGKVHVNFDSNVFELLHEIRWMIRLKIPLPTCVQGLCTRRRTLLRQVRELQYIVQRYYVLIDSVSAVYCYIVVPHINELNKTLNNGLLHYTWVSMNVDSYIQECMRHLESVQRRIQRANTMIQVRITASLEEISALRWVVFQEEPTCYQSISALLEAQYAYVTKVATRASTLNQEVASATRDMVHTVTLGYDSEKMDELSKNIDDIYTMFEQRVLHAIIQSMQHSVVHVKSRLVGSWTSLDCLGDTAEVLESPCTRSEPILRTVVEIGQSSNLVIFPSSDEIQKAINTVARSMLESTRLIFRWQQQANQPARTYPVSDFQNALLKEMKVDIGQEHKAQSKDLVAAAESDEEEELIPAAEKESLTVPGATSSGSVVSRLKDLYLRVGKNRKMTKVFLQLTGSVAPVERHVFAFLDRYKYLTPLWAGYRADEIEKFHSSRPSLSEYVQKMSSFDQTIAEVNAISSRQVIGCLLLDLSGFKVHVLKEINEWKVGYAGVLAQRARADTTALTTEVEGIESRLCRKISELADVNIMMSTIQQVRERETDFYSEVAPLLQAYSVLHSQGITFARDEQENVDILTTRWDKIVAQSHAAMDHLQTIAPQYKAMLFKDTHSFKMAFKAFKKDYDTQGPMVRDLNPRTAIDRLHHFQKQFEDKSRKLQEIRIGEELYALPPTPFPELEAMETELKLLASLYEVYEDVLNRLHVFDETMWDEVHVEQMESIGVDLKIRCGRLDDRMHDWSAYRVMKLTIDRFVGTLPLIAKLRHSSVMPRHWEQLSNLCGVSLSPNMGQVRLKTVINANIYKYESEIEDITTAAQKELDIDQKLQRIEDTWLKCEVQLSTFKSRGLLLLKPDRTREIIQEMEDTLGVLTSLMSSRFNAVFKKEIMTWIHRLSGCQERIEAWLDVQHSWTHMETVFNSTSDIAREMPTEVKKFMNVDRQWCKIMKYVAENPSLLKLCVNGEMLSNLLPHMRAYLDGCQRSLSGYLSSKRSSFPRFFFVSDGQLLQILSEGSDASNVQGHLLSIFNNINKVDIEGSRITGFHSVEGEFTRLVKPVSVQDEDLVVWLHSLVQTTRRTVQSQIRDTMMTVHMLLEESIAPDKVEKFCLLNAQIALFVLQVVWTSDCEHILTTSKGDRSQTNTKSRKAKAILEALISLTNIKHFTPLQRTKLETIITINLHQYDVMTNVIIRPQKKLRGTNDFEWSRQSRAYWKSDSQQGVLSITDVDLNYAFEYVGCVERLVVTDLTDRIYISCVQAINMSYGAAPTGPAGTGKTETTKDLGRACARYFLVTNCGETMTTDIMGRWFKGIAQEGCWCAFDEINRIDVSVLSVVAQQIATVFNARKDCKSEFMFADGTLSKLNREGAVFITMNPDYAGRSQLPENMKAIFRTISVVVPDRLQIIRVRLAAAGFQENNGLARKFTTLYQLCEEQLSHQSQYDFGLRNILSVVRTCGSTLRSLSTAEWAMLNTPSSSGEVRVLVQVLRDMNESKLTEHDAPLFSALLSDLFMNTLPLPVPSRKQNLRTEVEHEIKTMNLDACSGWLMKLFQIREQQEVRHGMCIMGDSCSGKTTALNALSGALSRVVSPIKQYRINPKAISVPHMFGALDKKTQDWTEGILTLVWKKCLRRRAEHSWIVLDGPVDPNWIENLNTVLDDTRTLTIANGDRIAMSTSMTLILEVESMKNASPSTVSRLGMVFIGNVLPWTSVLQSWSVRVRNNRLFPSETVLTVVAVIESLFPLCLPYVTTCKTAIHLPSQTFIVHVCRMVEALLHHYSADISLFTKSSAEKIGLMALVWGVGGPLDIPEQTTLHDILVKAGCAMPTTGGIIFDYFLDLRKDGWSSNAHAMQSAKETIPISMDNMSRVVVPTLETIRLGKFLDVCLGSHFSVTVLGENGMGKTSTLQNYLAGSKPSNVSVLAKQMAFSAVTSPSILQRSIESTVDKISGSTWGPAPGRAVVLFIDDMNMPSVNEWGDQETNELLRQLMEDGGFYHTNSKQCDWINIVSFQVLAAMRSAESGENDIPSRLKRFFCVFNMGTPSTTTIAAIYKQLMQPHFPWCRELAAKLIDVACDVWGQVKSRFYPTMTKFLYRFTLNDLTSLVLTMAHAAPRFPKEVTQLQAFFQVQCERIFTDKLSTSVEADEVTKILRDETKKHFGNDFPKPDPHRCFLGTTSTGMIQSLTMPQVIDVLMRAQSDYNEIHKRDPLKLVLFDFAVQQLLRIHRVISVPRGHALLVGIGGGGKASLTKVATILSGHKLFKLRTHPNYTQLNFLDDLREAYKLAVIQGPLVVLLLDQDIRDESFLEYINMLLSCGEISALYAKDEMEAMLEEMRPYAERDPNFDGTSDALQRFLIARARDNLHLVLCFSPSTGNLRTRCLRFPGLVRSCSTIMMHAWPVEALSATASAFMGTVTPVLRQSLVQDLPGVFANIYYAIDALTEKTQGRAGDKIHVTPKMYLGFLEVFARIYKQMSEGLITDAESIRRGLQKLQQAESEILTLKEELRKKIGTLTKSATKLELMLHDIQDKSKAAETSTQEIQAVKDALAEQAADIAREKSEAVLELKKAEPVLHAAAEALLTIKADDVAALKKMLTPPTMVRRIMDGVLLVRQLPIEAPAALELDPSSGARIIRPSWAHAKPMIADIHFLQSLIEFDRDSLNGETVELLLPYLWEEDFTVERARTSASSVAGLCTWLRCLVKYYDVLKEIQPKRLRMQTASAKLTKARLALSKSEAEVAVRVAELNEFKSKYQEAHGAKMLLQADAEKTRSNIEVAEILISGLSSESTRWQGQSLSFEERISKLPGDAVTAAVFLKYCPPFDHQRRHVILTEIVLGELIQKRISFTPGAAPHKFLATDMEIGRWLLEGLPHDEMSIQNATMVRTYPDTFTLFVDPQSMGKNWILQSHRGKVVSATPTSKNLMDVLESAVSQGLVMILEDVTEDFDFGAVDTLLTKTYLKVLLPDGSWVNFVQLAGKEIAVHDNFRLFLTTRIAAPVFIPELYAKIPIVNFNITRTGLEEHLLALVVSTEKPHLEEDRAKLMNEIQACSQIVKKCEDDLLFKLSTSQGKMLEDNALLEVLLETKARAKQVSETLAAAVENETKIRAARDEYRCIALRGCVFYFVLQDMERVLRMYHTGLEHYLSLFTYSLTHSPRSTYTLKRIESILKYLTEHMYKHAVLGYYVQHQLFFSLLLAIHVEQVSPRGISAHEYNLLLRASGAVDVSSSATSPPPWFESAEIWANVHALATISGLRKLPGYMVSQESVWSAWLTCDNPEATPTPEGAVNDVLTHFQRLVFIRCVRPDRLVPAAMIYIGHVLGPMFVEAVPLDYKAVSDAVSPHNPVLCLLVAGSDPTSNIEALARKMKQTLRVISLGDGTEAAARHAMSTMLVEGGWVVLLNCHLGVKYCNELCDVLHNIEAGNTKFCSPQSRLWLTSFPSPHFPMGLLQRCVKITEEPPRGIKASLMRCYASWLTQDQIEAVPCKEWRQLLYSLCLLHSIYVERKKFGSLGWCSPYDFTQHDLVASTQFLYYYLYTDLKEFKKGGNWRAVQYMVCEVHYGGRVTDNYDKLILNTLGEKFFCDAIFGKDFSFAAGYACPDFRTVQDYVHYIDGMPTSDSPSLFGLHSNAEMSYNKHTGAHYISLLTTVSQSRTEGKGKQSADAEVLAICSKVIAILDQGKIDSSAVLKKIPSQPVNNFLEQETAGLHDVIQIVMQTCHSVAAAIDGHVVMNAAVQQSYNELADCRIPALWSTRVASPTDSLWSWVDNVNKRIDQMRRWASKGRLKAFCFSRFLRPSGFLSAVKQECTRAHSGWSLDNVQLKCETTKHFNPDSREFNATSQDEGTYCIYGLSLEGASWDRSANCLVDAAPHKNLYCPLPIIRLSLVVSTTVVADNRSYMCPVYTLPSRTKRNFIFDVPLRTEDGHPGVWILRGVAALCCTE